MPGTYTNRMRSLAQHAIAKLECCETNTPAGSLIQSWHEQAQEYVTACGQCYWCAIADDLRSKFITAKEGRYPLNLTKFKKGDRVVFPEAEECYPHFIIPAGTTGTVTAAGEDGTYDPFDMLVKVDGFVDGLTNSEWKGEYQWNPSNWAEDPPLQRPPFEHVKES